MIPLNGAALTKVSTGAIAGVNPLPLNNVVTESGPPDDLIFKTALYAPIAEGTKETGRLILPLTGITVPAVKEGTKAGLLLITLPNTTGRLPVFRTVKMKFHELPVCTFP